MSASNAAAGGAGRAAPLPPVFPPRAACVQLMGILNVTPDSFSDGGLATNPIAAGFAMLEAGADIIDVGGESTRPGADPVDPAEEQQRVLPVVAALARAGARISLDSRNAATMAAALGAGAAMINDVSALRHDPAAAPLVARAGCDVVLMHMRGTPRTMRDHAIYNDVVSEVRHELAERVAQAEAAGIDRRRITIDPGFGFAKTPAQGLDLLRNLAALAALGLPILAGLSRKAMIGQYGQQPDPRKRVPGSIAAALFAVSQGASIIRVHDVAETKQALRLWQALNAVS